MENADYNAKKLSRFMFRCANICYLSQLFSPKKNSKKDTFTGKTVQEKNHTPFIPRSLFINSV